MLFPFVFAELPFPSLTSVEPSLLTFTEALELLEEDSLVTLLDDVDEDDESVLSLELPHAAKVNKARTETEAKVSLENIFIIVSLFLNTSIVNEKLEIRKRSQTILSNCNPSVMVVLC